MAEIIKISDLGDPRLDAFVRLTGHQLRNKLEPEAGVFIVESPIAIEAAFDAGCEPLALLTEERYVHGKTAGIIERVGNVPVYAAPHDVLAGLTGFELTRGVLCTMKRPAERDWRELCKCARRVAVLENIVDTTNLGAIFRCAAGLGIDAVLLSPECCDPLCRRAVRRINMSFIRYSKLLKDSSSLLYYRQIAVASHDKSDLFHRSSRLYQ